MVKSKLLIHLKNTDEDFLGGPVDTSTPASAEDTGLIPGEGRFLSCGAAEPLCYN